MVITKWSISNHVQFSQIRGRRTASTHRPRELGGWLYGAFDAANLAYVSADRMRAQNDSVL